MTIEDFNIFCFLTTASSLLQEPSVTVEDLWELYLKVTRGSGWHNTYVGGGGGLG